MDEAGALIAGRYELLEIAGRGGMATVWRGSTIGAAGFRRPVAVKRILPQFAADAEFVRMFIEEARVGSQLQHPNIVQIHDFGEDELGNYFLVMEWVEGIDLGRLVYSFFGARTQTPWPLIAAIEIEVLRALAAAHERPQGPVIHRDVNPQNILVGENGVVKLTDFGLARAMDRGRMTHPDVIKGKLSYLAPEMAHGQEPTTRSDLFSAGVVLWEALSGRKLFTGASDIDVLLGVREAHAPPLLDLRVELPVVLSALVARALRLDPAERFASADEMRRALAGLLREVDGRTDERAIADCVLAARERLARLPPPLPSRGSISATNS